MLEHHDSTKVISTQKQIMESEDDYEKQYGERSDRNPRNPGDLGNPGGSGGLDKPKGEKYDDPRYYPHGSGGPGDLLVSLQGSPGAKVENSGFKCWTSFEWKVPSCQCKRLRQKMGDRERNNKGGALGCYFYSCLLQDIYSKEIGEISLGEIACDAK